MYNNTIGRKDNKKDEFEYSRTRLFLICKRSKLTISKIGKGLHYL